MAGSATAETLRPPTAEETGKPEYAHSSRTLAQWGGELLVRETTALEETNPLRKSVYDDYISALREMLNTDPKYGQHLDIDDTGHEFPIIDGKICDHNGKPIIDIVTTGAESSAAMAEDYEEWQGFAERDASDVEVAKINEKLLPGQIHTVINWDPKKQLKQFKKLYKGKGYREGLVWIHTFCKTHDNKLIGSYYSLEVKDEAKFLKVLADHGVYIPPNSEYNQRSRHGSVKDASPEEADTEVRAMRQAQYKAEGITRPRHSVTEYVNQNKATVDKFFNAYYPSLAKASKTSKNNQILEGFAQTILSLRIRKLQPEIRQTLIKVANSSEFNDEAVKTNDSLIRYAVVEELRKGLGEYIGLSPSSTSVYSKVGRHVVWHNQINQSSAAPDSRFIHANQLLALNLSEGVSAGRDYGGCPGVQIREEDESNNLTSGISSITYSIEEGSWSGRGGRGKRRKFGESEDEDCEFVSKKCPECKKTNVKTTVTKKGGRKHVSGDCGCSKTY